MPERLEEYDSPSRLDAEPDRLRVEGDAPSRLDAGPAPGRLDAGPTRLGDSGGPGRLGDAIGGERYQQNDHYALEQGGAGIGMAIAGELVKSYGWKYDDEKKMWDWSLGNIGEAFEDSPIWTSLDWLTLGFAPARWGLAAGRMAATAGKLGTVGKAALGSASGMGRAGRAYEAGEIGLREAVKAHQATGTARNAFGRAFSNPITKQLPDENLARFGTDPLEVRGLVDVQKREMAFEREAYKRLGQDAIKAQGKVSEGAQQKMMEAMEAGIKPGDDVIAALGPNAETAYQKMFAYRNQLHESARDTNMLSEETYLRNLEKYLPRQYEEYIAMNPHLKKGAQGSGRQSFLSRTAEDHPDLTRIWSTELSIVKMAKAADLVATQKFAQKLANSAVAKTGDELVEYIERYADNPKMRKMLMGDNDSAHRFWKEAVETGQAHVAEVQDEVFASMGWRKFDDVFASAKLPEYMRRLPDELKGKYIDPAAMDDVIGIFEGFGGEGARDGFAAFMTKFYHRSLNMFRASKTAYNPPTHARNYISGIIFHHLATGGVPKFVPTKGIKALKEMGEEYTEAVRAGVIGSSFDAEAHKLLKDVFKKHGDMAALEKLESGQATAIDFIGDSRVAKMLQGGAGKAEAFYRSIDEVWKLDAFIVLKKKFAKGGLMSADQARDRAILEVNKFMPQFTTASPIGDFIRRDVPFASFTTEALRIWKNAIQQKPHLAFAWNHFTESASYAIGAAAGYSPEDLDAFRKLAPEYTHNKKMLLMPFKVGGRPAFFDMSYHIPLANISDSEDAEHMFFGVIPSPAQNPFFGGAIAMVTQKDPFTRKELAPRFSEQQLGVVVDQPHLRTILGLGEHMLATMLPPLAPPGFSANNLIELARGQKHPVTGELLEPNWQTTIAANLFGMRTVEASVASGLLNARRREGRIGDKMKIWRRAYERARVNGDVTMMHTSEDNIKVLRENLHPGSSEAYFDDFVKRTEPGKYHGIGTRQLKAAYADARRLRSRGGFSAEDKQTMGELAARLREKKGGRRSRSGSVTKRR